MASPTFVDFVAGEDTTANPWAPHRDSWREIGGAIVSGAIVGALLVLWNERLERERERRDDAIAERQAARDEWTALLLQLAGRSDLRGLNMAGRDLHNVVLVDVDLRESDLSGTSLVGAYLPGVNLDYSDLLGVDLRGAVLTKASLRHANVAHAKLEGADFRKADLRGLDLSRAVMHTADFDALTSEELALSRVANLDLGVRPTYFGGALHDHTTVWPTGFGPPPS